MGSEIVKNLHLRTGTPNYSVPKSEIFYALVLKRDIVIDARDFWFFNLLCALSFPMISS